MTTKGDQGQIGKEEVKISLFADDMIVSISDPKNSTKELLNLINSFSAVAGYKINSNKSVAFLYTNSKQAEKEIRETPFTIVTSIIRHLGVTLTKEVRDLYDKNLKSLKKEIKDLRLKNSYLVECNLQIQCNPHQNSNSILHQVRKDNLQIHLE